MNKENNFDNMISKGIEDALKAKRQNYVTNILDLSKQSNIITSEMSPRDLEKAAEVFSAVSEAHEDIIRIESGEQFENKNLYKKIRSQIAELPSLHNDIINFQRGTINHLKSIISNFVLQTGPNRNSSLLLKDIMNQENDYLANHSINVTIVALTTAIELTKLMEKKLHSSKIKKKSAELKIIKDKTFNLEELENLGTAAFVHDIYYKKIFPDLKYNHDMSGFKERSHIEKHSSESYHIIRKFDIDFHVNKAVLQHHEKIDGSGHPDGIPIRMFSKYTSILSFAERFIELTQPNPFNKIVHPTVALKHMLTTEKNSYDSDILIAFAKAASMVPIGSWVLLENDLIGYSHAKIENSDLPLIKVVMQNNGEFLKEQKIIKVNEPGSRIKSLLLPRQLNQLNPKWLQTYFHNN